MSLRDPNFDAQLKRRHLISKCFETLCFLSTGIGIVVLSVLLAAVLWKAWGYLDWQFITSHDSIYPEKAGVLAGIWGTFWLLIFTGLFAIPISIGAALYLEEFAKDSWMKKIIQVNISNLAGVPSIVYGILGLTVFVRFFDLVSRDTPDRFINLGLVEIKIPVPFGNTILSASMTMALLVLPIIIIACQEALRAIPPSLRHASLALGATKWQTIRHQVLPAALPGMMTGVILAMSRAIGETAPLIVVGASAFLLQTPGGIDSPVELLTNPQGLASVPSSNYSCLPFQIYNFAKDPREEFKSVAAAAIVVLLVILLIMNGIAVLIRHRFGKNLRW